jgi:hypothetical protein
MVTEYQGHVEHSDIQHNGTMVKIQFKYIWMVVEHRSYDARANEFLFPGMPLISFLLKYFEGGHKS